ncbi:hypothetical protein AD951_09455 [Acetobacter malorum]|uniref:Uncharacterized protein n=1 Tax=Acetobacter malorum TaxID=178901 RepID=A0A149ULI8_9PROT|nr:hypothetical protein [Acetobacter malorum]KXV68860.1 hypothetical protein AD951_09455 [Acetobacter malorum]
MLNAFDFASGILGVISAYFWYKATQGDLPAAPQKGDTIRAALFKEFFDTLNKQGKYNKKAAYSACLAAFVQGMKLLFQSISHQ